MAQRVLLGTCLVVTMFSLSLAGLAWRESYRLATGAVTANRDLAELAAQNQAASEARMAELLTKAQATNEEFLKQLQKMAKTPRSPQETDWVPVTFKLTEETLEGPPAVGLEISLGSSSSSIFAKTISRKSDATGLVDFGVVHPGDWEFELSKYVGQMHVWKCQGNIVNVLPGTKIVKTIICPKTPPIESIVKIHVPWPADLAGKRLRLEATFTHAPTTFQSPLKWMVEDLGDFTYTDQSHRILCDLGMTQTELGGVTKLKLWHFYVGNLSLNVQRVFADLHSQAVGPGSEGVAMDAGGYLLHRLIVMRPCVAKNLKVKDERFEVLAHTCRTEMSVGEVDSYSGDPVEGQNPLGSPWPLDGFKGAVAVSRSYWTRLEVPFSARPGQVNEWTVPLPEELIKVVREELASEEPSKSK